MRAIRLAAAAAALALLLPAPAVTAGDTFDFVRVLEMPSKSPGVWGARFGAKAAEGTLVGLAVAADWWDGPGDVRAGDPKLSAMPGIVFEVRHGEDGPWVALPSTDRDLRLTARAAAPADAKGLFGGSPDGEWSVRQKGGAYPLALRIELTCRGDALLVKDLRVKDLSLPNLDPKPVVGKPHLPDRTENRTLKGGDGVEAVVVVENCGARKTKEVDLDLLVAPCGKRQGARLAFAQVPALEPGASAELKLAGVLPADFAKEKGVYEIVAFANPRGTEREVESFNNALTRAFRFEPPDPQAGLPPDIRDR